MQSNFLQTERLLLRASEISDASAFYGLIKKNYGRLKEAFPKSSAAAETPEKALEYLRQLKTNEENKIAFNFLVFEKENKKPIGMFFIKTIDWTVPKCELAYFIAAEMEGKGLVKEGIKAICNYCFDTLGMNKIFIRTSVANNRSAAIALSCGFLKEGRLRNDFRSGTGELQDVEYFGKIKT
jgi:ribosomal-protein-serine acetyltransferase